MLTRSGREYDADRNEIARIDPLGHRTEWTFDERGNPRTQTDPLGRTTTSTWDARNNLLTLYCSHVRKPFPASALADFSPQMIKFAFP